MGLTPQRLPKRVPASTPKGIAPLMMNLYIEKCHKNSGSCFNHYRGCKTGVKRQQDISRSSCH
ncbi:Uncharacterised protein [Mycobacteroides abscessus subsp. abscessus]|nr:Uncharacterised protein [Mycobacteroides abscessus subsp. abscessus]